MSIGEVRYLKLAVEPHDLLSCCLESLGLSLVWTNREAACRAEPALINCLTASDDTAAPPAKRPQST
jgi:hypothetical protein